MKNFLILSLTLLSACATTVKPGVSIPMTAEVSLSNQGDHRVGTYTSSWKGFRTSSYWIEGPTGLIVIDTQFLPSAAEEMLNWAEQVTGKKVVLAIVLHPNPDKFNGTANFQRRGIKVVTSAQVLKLIPSVHQLRTEWFYDRFKPDYPAVQPVLESFGSQTTALTAGGITVKAYVMGAGCSDEHVVVEFDHNLFVGDLVTIGFHSWLELGRINEWIDRIEELKKLKPAFVRTGRGGTGDMDTLQSEEDYLKTVRKIVLSHHPKKGTEISDATEEKIASQIFAAYPSYLFHPFVENGLEALWKNLSR